MDEMEFLVQETFRLSHMLQEGEDVSHLPLAAVPSAPGLLYHLQDSGPVFVVRTLVSEDLARDHARVLAHPEEFPTLRLLENGGEVRSRLRWFAVEDLAQADHVHERVGQRRFPRREEDVCNLSDPGFGWRIEESEAQFTLYGKMNWGKENLKRLGPVYDVNLAQGRWVDLATLLANLQVAVDVTSEVSKLSMSSTEASWLVEEFKRVFVDGIVSPEMRELFVILGKRKAAPALLETCWYFLQEAAAARRFWSTIQRELV